MATAFKDKKGREWDVSLDLRKARLIDKSDFKEQWDKEFSILQLDQHLIQKLLTDAPFLFAVIWAMVQEQVESKWQAFLSWQQAEAAQEPRGGFNPDPKPPADTFPLSPKDTETAELEFISGIHGPTIEAARTAFIEALGDFFPEQRTALSMLARQLKGLNNKMEKKLEATEPLMDELINEEMDLRIDKWKADLRKARELNNGGTSTPSRATPELALETSGVQASP